MAPPPPSASYLWKFDDDDDTDDSDDSDSERFRRRNNYDDYDDFEDKLDSFEEGSEFKFSEKSQKKGGGSFSKKPRS